MNDSQPISRFLVFEGPDGSGKTSQLNLAAKFIKDNVKGQDPLILKSPGGSELAEVIRKNVLSRQGMPNEVRLHAMLLSMLSTTVELVQPAIQSGRWVLMDRYLLSTIVYQGLLAGNSVYKIKEAINGVFDDKKIKPDAYFVYNVSPKTSMARIDARNETKTVFETKELIERMNPAYQFSKSLVDENVFYIDGEGSIEEVWNRTRPNIAMFL